MPSSVTLANLAQQIQVAQDECHQIAPFTSQFPDFDVPSAYMVADLVHKTRVQQGAVPVGRKIGFTNPDMWVIYGVQEPIWAYVYSDTVVRLDSSAYSICSIGKLAEPKIEPEIIFHFRTAPTASGDPLAILDCIDWVAHGFEIVQSHFPGWKFQAADTVADWALHGRLFVGEPQQFERLGPNLVAALQDFSLNLFCNGILRETGTGGNVLGSPLLAIAHLISVLAKQPEYAPIQANELITTGTITTAQSVQSGEIWRTQLQGIALPGISLEITP